MGPWKALVFRILILSLRLNMFYSLAGAGKSVLTYVTLSIFPLRKLTMCRHAVLQLSRISAGCAQLD